MSLDKPETKIIDDIIFEKLKMDQKYSLTNASIILRKTNDEGTTEIQYSNKIKEFLFANGIRKRIYDDGLIILTMANNDVKIVLYYLFNYLVLY